MPKVDIKTVEFIAKLRRMDVISAHEHIVGFVTQHNLSLAQENLRLREALSKIERHPSAEPTIGAIAHTALHHGRTQR